MNLYAAGFRTEDVATMHLGWKNQHPSCFNATVATLRMHLVSVLGRKFGQRRSIYLYLPQQDGPSSSRLAG
jgi:hypothetical protein